MNDCRTCDRQELCDKEGRLVPVVTMNTRYRIIAPGTICPKEEQKVEQNKHFVYFEDVYFAIVKNGLMDSDIHRALYSVSVQKGIVRCKNCKHRRKTNCPLIQADSAFNEDYGDDWYCADGERK